MLAVGSEDFAEIYCSAITQLPGPMAELVAAVTECVGFEAGQGFIAAKEGGEFVFAHGVRRQAEFSTEFARPGQ